MAELIPIFPLGVVLLPGLPLPVHVFEPRYRRMLADVSASGERAAFGVVALYRGTDTSADVSFATVGTLAEILERHPYPDGSCDLLTVGSRRFQVTGVDDAGAPYLRARVEWLDEVDGGLSPGLLDAALRAYRRYAALLAERSDAELREPPGGDALRVSYEIAGSLPLGLVDRQRLLGAETVAERLLGELRLIRRELVLLRRTGTVPVDPNALRLLPGSN